MADDTLGSNAQSQLKSIVERIERLDVEEFHRRLQAQGAPSRRDLAFVCPMCATVQSARTLVREGAGKDFDEVEKFLGFSCVGRFNNAGPPPPKPLEGGARGCNWTLGGLLRLHRLEVVTPDGEAHARFELATTEQTLALAAREGRLPEAVDV